MNTVAESHFYTNSNQGLSVQSAQTGEVTKVITLKTLSM